MRPDLTPEQSMLKETVTRLVTDTYDFETRRAVQAEPGGWSRTLWSSLAELGVLAALAPEDAGGLGGGGVEAMLIAETLGSALSAEPFLPSVVMGGGVLAELGHPALADIIAGELTLSWIGQGPELSSDDDTLSGFAVSAPWADTADRLMVVAAGTEGPVLLLVDPSASQVHLDAHRTFDGLPVASVTFDALPAGAFERLAAGPAAVDLIERAEQRAIAWLAGEGVGLMAMVLDTTVEHLKSRVQFGQPLAAFQALQHRAAEMLVALEHARSAAILAATAHDEPDPVERRKLFAAVKFALSESSHIVGAGGVQLHGGIGVTEEHKVGWAFRRLTMIELLHGDADAQASALADLGGFVSAD